MGDGGAAHHLLINEEASGGVLPVGRQNAERRTRPLDLLHEFRPQGNVLHGAGDAPAELPTLVVVLVGPGWRGLGALGLLPTELLDGHRNEHRQLIGDTAREGLEHTAPEVHVLRERDVIQVIPNLEPAG